MSYDPGWKPITSALPTAADTNQIKRYQGVRVFIRGAKGEGLGYTPYTPSAVAIGQTADAVVIGSRIVQLLEETPSTERVQCLERFLRDIREALDK
jgi:tryptophan synthase alpha subunit